MERLIPIGCTPRKQSTTMQSLTDNMKLKDGLEVKQTKVSQKFDFQEIISTFVLVMSFTEYKKLNNFIFQPFTGVFIFLFTGQKKCIKNLHFSSFMKSYCYCEITRAL